MRVIIDFFLNIVDWILGLASDVLSWFLELCESAFSVLLDSVLELIPDLSVMWSYLEPVQPYTAFINQWVAIDTASSLISAYFVFISTMISVKLFVKLFIPTVG